MPARHQFLPFRARSRCICRISASVTVSASPPVFLDSGQGFFCIDRCTDPDCRGNSLRIIFGITSGRFSRIALTNGLDPSAWIPVIIGIWSMNPSSCSSRNPLYTADIFPAFPTGRTNRSGTSPAGREPQNQSFSGLQDGKG